MIKRVLIFYILCCCINILVAGEIIPDDITASFPVIKKGRLWCVRPLVSLRGEHSLSPDELIYVIGNKAVAEGRRPETFQAILFEEVAGRLVEPSQLITLVLPLFHACSIDHGAQIMTERMLASAVTSSKIEKATERSINSWIKYPTIIVDGED